MAGGNRGKQGEPLLLTCACLPPMRGRAQGVSRGRRLFLDPIDALFNGIASPRHDRDGRG
jgi:hypothetical protein